MNWLTVVWSMCAAACAMLGLLHLLLWWTDRGTPVYMLSALMALGATGNAVTELYLFHAPSVSTYASLLQWEVLFVYILLVPMIWFVYVRLGTARRWLAGIIMDNAPDYCLHTRCCVTQLAPGSQTPGCDYRR